MAVRTFTDGNSCLASDISSEMEEEGDNPLLMVEILSMLLATGCY